MNMHGPDIGALNLNSLTHRKSWLLVEDIMPRQNHEVLLYGRDGHCQVGTLEYPTKLWKVAGKILPFETFTHWQFLPEVPGK